VKKNHRYIKSLPPGGEPAPQFGGFRERQKRNDTKIHREKQNETKRSLFISRFSSSHFISGRV
jgi:hypothetical protein